MLIMGTIKPIEQYEYIYNICIVLWNIQSISMDFVPNTIGKSIPIDNTIAERKRTEKNSNALQNTTKKTKDWVE